ncbi:hypothetical protein ACFO5R_20705 [Halosolutus amylolyticus]|uniref:Uncharacterized protein n=1 Tax=Halosolutus amylolyticus TaxID=2932267 RepID=A0ABD5PV00_9EURY|nr:hypothetical protein [Halosolutus amylolyticus]
MRRPTKIVLALLLAVSMAAMPLAAADVGAAANAQEQDAEDEESVAPGEQLAAVVGVQEAELDGEVSERAYGIKVAAAQTEDARADVVLEQQADVEKRIADLENRTAELNAAYEDGELTRGQYEGRMAAIAAEQRTAERLANGTAATASELENPEAHGIDVDAIQTLAETASELTGPEVAEIARSIAGEGVGQPVDADREPGAPIEPPAADGDAPEDADDPETPDTDGDEDESDADEQNGTDTEEPASEAGDEQAQDDAGSQ